MDDEGTRQAAKQELDAAAMESYLAAVEHAFELQREGMKLSSAFFQNWVETLEKGAEVNRRTLEDLQRIAAEQRRVFYGLSRESLHAYGGFAESISSYQDQVEE